MIDAIVYRSGIIRRSWKFKFVGANGKKFGHQYNDADNAVDAVRTLVSPNIGVRLLVQNEDGTVTNYGRIR
jgi:hypothetical protein